MTYIEEDADLPILTWKNLILGLNVNLTKVKSKEIANEIIEKQQKEY